MELFLSFKQRIYIKQLFEIELFLDFNCELMLNRIVWNRTVYMYKNGFGIK